MGLDMYLEARKYVSQYDFGKWTRSGEIPTNEEYANVKALFPEQLTKHSDSGATIAINVGYWRKANAIHDWFVNNVQDGEDNCREYRVTTEQLRELREACEQVLADPDQAPDLLPTQAGFFFGGTDYDEYYFECVKQTKEIMDNILGTENVDEYAFYYQSSW
jgi:hypothetical protein